MNFPPMFKGWRMEDIQSGGIRRKLRSSNDKQQLKKELRCRSSTFCLLTHIRELNAWFHLQVSLGATSYRP